ncbi:cation:proton antiporter [Zoogloeaceae bacterium G21618-S1]|nr:cation:proton antiporter [Zoogloeaceae bacterium G21618-S1]
MTAELWFLLVGGLLLVMGLTPRIISQLPVTPAIIYLTIGLLAGPSVFSVFHFNPLKQSALLEVLTEVAVLISLFSAGVKMPVPITFDRWRTPVLLATVSMVASVAMVTAYSYYALGLSLGAAVLLGAIVAPTDPVLATDVQIRHPGDRDRLRFNLTCEAGMNDGSAFPFVMLGLGLLGLHDIGEFGWRWAVIDVLWATMAGIAIGSVLGALLARLSMAVRPHGNGHDLMDDFLGLGLIGFVYGLSELANAWGFLAVFFAAVSLRQTELKYIKQSARHPQVTTDEQAAHLAASTTKESLTVSKGSLIFKEHLERLSELLLILLVGGSLFLDSWSWRAIGFSLFLFVVARPLSVMLGLLGTRTPWRIRGMVGWFGVRGIGSLYYLMYAIQHGLPEEVALDLIHMTLLAIVLSILAHGISVKPMMDRFWRR